MVTYACETLVLKEYCKEKLLAFERKILRKIYGPLKEIDDTCRIIRNYEFCHIIGIRNIVNFIRSQRLKWFRNLYSMNSERLVKGIHTLKPFATRSAGRPKSRWKDFFFFSH
jgi:hypothetical protein